MDKHTHKAKAIQEHGKTSDYIIAVILNIALIYFFARLTGWFSFLSSGFNAVLWLFYISFAASIVCNIAYIIYRADWFRALTQLALNVFSFIIIYVLLKIFPFDLNQANEKIARLVIYIVLLGIFIGIVVETSKLFFYLLSGRNKVNEQ